MENGHYQFNVEGGTRKGAFNIYQGRSGGIYLLMNTRYILLTRDQVNALSVPLLELRDFDMEDYTDFYNKTTA